MAKPKTKPEPTGTVQAHREREAQRQADARTERNRIAAETRAAREATAKFLASKPIDTRGLDRA